MTTRATYKSMSIAMKTALDELEILSGNVVDSKLDRDSWQAVASSCANHLRILARQLDAAQQGHAEPFVCFPSPTEWKD